MHYPSRVVRVEGIIISKLESIIQASKFIQELSVLDCSVTICDREGTIIHFLPPTTFAMTGKAGDKIATSGALFEAMQTAKKSQRVLNKEFFGTPVKVIAVPIFEDDIQIGAVGIAINLSTQSTLQEAAQTIAATSQQVVATTQELAAAATVLAGNLEKLRDNGHNVMEEIKRTDDVLKFVSDVATNSKLLSLNASIEAARVGESGRGFAVVASEIGKMAASSDQAVKDIKETLSAIWQDTTNMVSTVKDTSELGMRQAAATEEIAATMQNLAMSAANVEKIAAII